MVNNVYVSAVTQDNISRHELLTWVNGSIQTSLAKIEEMSTGAAYCQLTHLLFPDSITLKKVKWNSRNEVDWINNWKILQTTWKDLGIDKPVPVERLLRAKFQENFEFLQWFKKFFDANYDGRDYDALGARGGEAFPIGGKGAPAARAPVPAASRASLTARPAPAAAANGVANKRSTPSAAVTTTRPSPAAAPRGTAKTSPPQTVASTAAKAPSAQPTSSAVAEYQATIDDLEKRVEEYSEAYAALEKERDAKLAEYVEAYASVEKERDFYFAKLQRIEEMVTGLPDGSPRVLDADAVQAILYETEEIAESEAMNGAAAEEERLDDVAAPDSPIPVAAVTAAVAQVALVDDDETF